MKNGTEIDASPVGMAFRLHHVAIQTADLEASIAWYQEFLGAQVSWTLDRFSALTQERLPGISLLAEVTLRSVRFHMFTCGGADAMPPPDHGNRVQHVCLQVDSPSALHTLHQRWHEIRRSGRYTFVGPADATDVVVDEDGVMSFYANDTNGIEFEISYLPGERG